MWATIQEKKTVAKDTTVITFFFEQDFSFSPGQYVWVIVSELLYPDLKGGRRAFSIISSSLNKKSCSILFRNSDSGYIKTLLELPLQSRVKILGPFGSSYSLKNQKQNIVMIAGGVGIAPFLSIINSLQEEMNPNLTLMYVNSASEKSAFSEELSRITAQQNIVFVNHIGKISNELFPSGINFAEDLFFICGPQGFIDETYVLLARRNTPFQNMRFEEHYPRINDTILTESDFNNEQTEKNIMLQAIQDSRNHVVITDVNGFVVFANKKAQQMTGFSFEEMKNNTPRLWGGIMTQDLYQKLWQTIRAGEGFDGELQNRRKNGEYYTVITHISPIKKEDRIIGFIGTEEDITHLEEERIYDEVLISSIGDGLIVTDEKGQIVRINQAIEELLGYTPQDLVERKLIEAIKAEDENGRVIPPAERIINKVLSRKEKISSAVIYTKKNGEKIAVLVTITPILLRNKLLGTVTVLHDVTREKQIDRAKSEFISLASHQLRTPLSTINWYCELLLSGDAGNVTDEQKKFIQEAYQGSQRLSKLVNALLNVSRIETGNYMIEPEMVDIVRLTRSILDESKPMIDEKKLRVVLEKDDMPQIMLDPNLTTIILQNLLTNSIKYTNENGEIKISLKTIQQEEAVGGVKAEENSLLIEVEDNGIGITTMQQGKVFEKLFRADNVRVQNTDGTGLGLYLVKSLIDHCRGKIWFYSEENKGTTFFVLLPLSGMVKKDGNRRLK